MRVAERVVETRAFEISSWSDLKDSMTSSVTAHASASSLVAAYCTTDGYTFCLSQLSFKSWRVAIDKSGGRRGLHSPPVGLSPSCTYQHHVCVLSARMQ